MNRVSLHFWNVPEQIDPTRDGICSICLETMQKVATLFPCNHMFDERCIKTSLKKNKACPLCRGKASLLPSNEDLAKMIERTSGRERMQKACDQYRQNPPSEEKIALNPPAVRRPNRRIRRNPPPDHSYVMISAVAALASIAIWFPGNPQPIPNFRSLNHAASGIFASTLAISALVLFAIGCYSSRARSI